MPVSDEEKRIVVFLQLHPVREGAHIVAEVQLSGGAHAAQNALLSSGDRRVRGESRGLRRGLLHQSLISLSLKLSIAGPSHLPRNGTLTRPRIHQIPIPAPSNIRLPPSVGP